MIINKILFYLKMLDRTFFFLFQFLIKMLITVKL